MYALFEELAPRVPLLAAVKPNGDRTIAEFEAAGGALALLRQLGPLVDGGQRTVAGITIGEAIAGATVADEDVIRLDLEVPPEELERRRAQLPPLRAPAGCGWLSVYARTVSPLDR